MTERPLTGGQRYEAAVAALFARRPHRLVRGLGRIRAVADLLGSPQRQYPVVHITGTNAKTSLARMVTALLRAHGLRVGTFTSPHLQDVRERVRVDTRMIPPDEFLGLLTELGPVLDQVERQCGEMVTFFETIAALAYQHFAREQVDAVVVEVGMGGRLDATNIADGRVAVLGPVGLDHPELGSRLGQVAHEKAGIIKPGGVAVSARQHPEAARVIADEADEAAARLLVEGRDFGVVAAEPVPGGQRLDLRGVGGAGGAVRDIVLPLAGVHQAGNAAVALAAAEAFLRRPVSAERVRVGLASVRTPGRLELVRRSGAPDVLLDGAHNAEAARGLAAAVRADFERFPNRVLVLGVLGDKDIDGILRALLPVCGQIVLAPAPSVRAATTGRLADAVRGHGRPAIPVPDVRAAVDRASTMVDPDTGLVVVTGSLYVVGAARDALGVDAC